MRKQPYIWTTVLVAGGVLCNFADFRIAASAWFFSAGLWASEIIKDLVDRKLRRRTHPVSIGFQVRRYGTNPDGTTDFNTIEEVEMMSISPEWKKP